MERVYHAHTNRDVHLASLTPFIGAAQVYITQYNSALVCCYQICYVMSITYLVIAHKVMQLPIVLHRYSTLYYIVARSALRASRATNSLIRYSYLLNTINTIYTVYTIVYTVNTVETVYTVYT